MACNLEFMAHGEGEGLRSGSACTPTRHQKAGSKLKARGLGGVCEHLSEAVRTRGQGFPGAASLALSTLRLTTLAKTQGGGASQRPSVLAEPKYFEYVVCCV